MIRVQFEMTEEKYKEFEALMQKAGVRTKKDLLNNALVLLEWFIKEKEAGRVVASIDEKEQKYKEVVMPMLSAAAA
jgi:hypothetical protein